MTNQNVIEKESKKGFQHFIFTRINICFGKVSLFFVVLGNSGFEYNVNVILTF